MHKNLARLHAIGPDLKKKLQQKNLNTAEVKVLHFAFSCWRQDLNHFLGCAYQDRV